MNQEQRAAALRLADELQRFDGTERESLRDEAAALLRELAAEPVQEPVGWFNDIDGEFEHSHKPWMDNTNEEWHPVYAAPQQIGSADIETKDEHHDLHRRSVAIMAKALDYSARMTEAMERIASVATDWRGSKPGEQK